MISLCRTSIAGALGAVLVTVSANGCSGKSTVDRTSVESNSGPIDPGTDEANVEAQRSSGEPAVITGMNVTGDCYGDGCSKRQFKAIATLSNGNKVILTKANYKTLGSTGEPNWQFSGDNVSCDTTEKLAFAPICSSTNGSSVTVRVLFTIKTTRFPNGVSSPTLTSNITLNQSAADSGKKLLLFVTDSTFLGDIAGGGASSGPAGGDYTCQTHLNSYLGAAFTVTYGAFAILSTQGMSLGQRVSSTTSSSIVQEETADSVKFSRPLYSMSGSALTPRIDLLFAAGVDLANGLRNRPVDLTSVITKGPVVDDLTVRLMRGCQDWSDNSNLYDSPSLSINTIGTGGTVTPGIALCNQTTSILCLAIER